MESYGPMNKAAGIMRTDALFTARAMSQYHLISNDSEMCICYCEPLPRCLTKLFDVQSRGSSSREGQVGTSQKCCPQRRSSTLTHFLPIHTSVTLCCPCPLPVLYNFMLRCDAWVKIGNIKKKDYIELNFHKWQKDWVLHWSPQNLPPSPPMMPILWIIINQNTIFLLHLLF